MSYLTAKQFSEKWEISERRIIKLCHENRINGAIKNGMVWLIPEDTLKPSDKRSKISQYLNTEKEIAIINIDHKISPELISILQKEGYLIDEIVEDDYQKSTGVNLIKSHFTTKEQIADLMRKTDQYYFGLIVLDIENKINPIVKETIVQEFAKKMYDDSTIVLVSHSESSDYQLIKKLSIPLKETIGARINGINLNYPKHQKVILNEKEIANDIAELLIRFKNTTGNIIESNGGCIAFEKDDRTKKLYTGDFYKSINQCFQKLTKGSYLWCASTMLQDEWTEEPLEMNFRVMNLEVANRGVTFDRIFIFRKEQIKEFKNNKTLKVYMQSNINTFFVDYDEIITKRPDLIKIVGAGWDGIDNTTLIVDVDNGTEERGYISINSTEVKRAYKCFQELKKYSKSLKEILK